MNNKPTIFSGVQPSGNLHIGNYLGSISQWVEMEDDFNRIFCIVDYHAITVKQDPKILKEKIFEIAKIYIASGIDPKKSTIFQQSDIKEHTELAWILNTITRNSDLTKMTQFKDKTGFDEDAFFIAMKEKTNDKVENMLAKAGVKIKKGLKDEEIKNLANIIYKISIESTLDVYKKHLKETFNKSTLGLFDYPVLMAADILLYNTDIVPVGRDQVQHLELTRTLARRFNDQYGNIFKIPEVKIRKFGAMIKGLDNPEKKMSKSASSELNYIALTDKPEIAKKKIMRATTDSDGIIRFDEDKKPGVSNLLTIYSLLAKKEIKELEKQYNGKGYGDLKKDLAEVVAEFLNDFQKKYNKISDKEVIDIMKKGADQIRPIAEDTIQKVKKAIGIN